MKEEMMRNEENSPHQSGIFAIADLILVSE